jgi:protein RecA
MAIADDRAKAVELALAQIEKQFGKGSIVRLGSREALLPIAVVSTGSISFDAALGVGGIPRGRVTEVFGPESSGKTTICLQIIAEAQRAGGLAAFVDAEHALDPSYAKKLGVDIDNLLVSQPDSGEQALEITETLVRSGAIDVLVVDSVAALVPKAELDGEMGDPHGPAGAAHVAGAAQAHRNRLEVAHRADLHQPDSREDRRDVRQSRRRPPAAGRSSFTRRCAWISGASQPSRMARR